MYRTHLAHSTIYERVPTFLIFHFCATKSSCDLIDSCGNDRSCLQRHESSVQQAKQNIDSKYVVVGILEELKASLGVFEKVLPDFFAGAVDHLSQIRNDTYTVNKKQMTDAAREYLANETALKLEYDLYNHARGKLISFFKTHFQNLSATV